MDGEKPLELADLARATALLTRLPVPVDHEAAAARGAAMAWAFPLVGGVLGLLAGIVAMICLGIGTGGGIAAAAALGTLVPATGAMHEDGLADCADGFGGGTPDERLAIMRDSRIGTYGTVAVALALLARWSGLAALDGWALMGALITAGAVSRAVMAFAMAAMVNARDDGLSAAVGRPDMPVAWAALGLALLIALLVTGFGALLIFVVAVAGALPVLIQAQRLIGGQTGDVLGGAQQCAEIAALAAAVIVLT
ncbi:MAG: adenosylcobinamide-GDP ribazoletransferase [Paracoccaceae bacterium]